MDDAPRRISRCVAWIPCSRCSQTFLLPSNYNQGCLPSDGHTSLQLWRHVLVLCPGLSSEALHSERARYVARTHGDAHLTAASARSSHLKYTAYPCRLKSSANHVFVEFSLLLLDITRMSVQYGYEYHVFRASRCSSSNISCNSTSFITVYLFYYISCCSWSHPHYATAYLPQPEYRS